MSGRWTIDELLARAPARLVRVTLGTCQVPADALVVDVRSADQQASEGPFPGAVAVDRTVLVAA